VDSVNKQMHLVNNHQPVGLDRLLHFLSRNKT
jgi:hypothetical protein